MEFVDTHAHLNDEAFENVEEIVANAKQNNVTKIICSAVDLETSLSSVELSKKYDEVFSTIGFHPENLGSFDDHSLGRLEELSKNKKVVAIGEIGLDYHYCADTKEQQKRVFAQQINLANKLDLPIVVHSRDSMGDTIEILKNHRPNRESVLHCYGGSVESARILLSYGFSFSFGGVCTFKNAKSMIEVIDFLPMDKILLETDCPYLSPEPFRGQRNEPKNIVYIADKISKIKNISLEEVAKITNENVKRIFKI